MMARKQQPAAMVVLLANALKDQTEMTELQRTYMNYANGRMLPKEDKFTQRCIDVTHEKLTEEHDKLQLFLGTAFGKVHVKRYEDYLCQIENHVHCQVWLSQQIRAVRVENSHLKMQLKILDKRKVMMQRQFMSDHQFQEYMVKIRKALHNLEQQLQAMKRRECATIRDNWRLRDTVTNMLYARQLFNRLTSQMINKLSHDKKFLIDMIDQATIAFNKGSEMCDRLNAVRNRAKLDRNQHITEMMEIEEKLEAADKLEKFLSVKGHTRPLRSLEEEMSRRRNRFMAENNRKKRMYELCIEKTIRHTGAKDIQEAMQLFKKHQADYFAHCNYMNELNNVYDFLNRSMNRFNKRIDQKRHDNAMDVLFQNNSLKDLHEQLINQTESKIRTETELTNYNSHINQLLVTIGNICKSCDCNIEPLQQLLGNHTTVTVHNVKQFLNILEQRLNKILRIVYHRECKTEPPKPNPVIQLIRSEASDPTDIDQIVLTQQCAECAISSEVNRYDRTIALPMTVRDIKEKVVTRTKAPEMQYRLHNLSKCNLARSRFLVNKRYN